MLVATGGVLGRKFWVSGAGAGSHGDRCRKKMWDMVSHTKQVPRNGIRITPRGRIVAVHRPMIFPEVLGAKRQYPGAQEGSFLAWYLNQLSAWPRKQKAFCDLLSPFMEVERPPDFSMRSIGRALDRAYPKLEAKIDRQGFPHVIEDGLVIPPTSDEGKAALAAILLFKEVRLSRIRRCLHCGTWFYAHLERQTFCSDRVKRCQWKHYHSPEWRKRNRELNRKHQRAYRERLFGKRR